MNNRVPIAKRLVLVNSFSFLLAHIINLVVMIGVVGYLYNLLPDSDFQLLAIIFSLRGLFLLGMGVVGAGLTRYIIESYAKADDDEVTRIITSVLFACIALGTFLCIAALVLSWHVDYLLADSPQNLGHARFTMALFLVSSSIFAAISPLGAGYQVRQKYVALNSIWLISTFIRSLLMVFLIFGIGPDVLWVVVANIIAQAIQSIWLIVGTMILVPAMRPKPSYYEWQTVLRQLNFGVWASIGRLAQLIRSSSDPILLARLASARDVNLFFVGSLVDRNIRGALMQAVQPILPALTAMHATDQQHRIQNTFVKGSRWLLWFGLFIAAPLMIYRQEIMAIYLWDKPESVEGAATVMFLLLLCWVPAFAFDLGPRIALAKADIKPLNTRMILVQGSNLIITIILITVFGMGAIGSATATVVAEFILAPLLLWSVVLKMVDLPWRRFLFETILPGVTPLALAGIMCEMLRNWVPPQGLLRLMDHLLPEVMKGSFGEALKVWFPSGGILILVLNIFLLWALYGLGILIAYTKSDKADFKKLFIAKLSKRDKKLIDNTLESSKDE